MRILDLGGWPEGADGDAYLRVLATMLFPEDAECRNGVLALPGAVSLSHRLAVAMMKSAYMKDAHFGDLAGNVLIAIRIIAEHHTEHEASVSKAAKILEDSVCRTRSLDGTRKIPVDERKIRGAWGRYRNVAHLWAAQSCLIRSLITPPTPPLADGWAEAEQDRLDFTGERFGEFLAVAEDMRRFGEQHQTRGHGECFVLDKKRVWRVPTDTPLPTASMQLPPLSTSAAKILNGYSARRRS